MAKHSMYQTMYDVAKMGGLFRKTCAEPFGQYYYWQKAGRECHPSIEDVQNSINDIYHLNFQRDIKQGILYDLKDPDKNSDLKYDLVLLNEKPLSWGLIANKSININTTKTFESEEGEQYEEEEE